MNELLHPAQVRAIEKLKKVRVGALYMERQEGKLRTVLELVRYRLDKDRIGGAIWLCAGRKAALIQDGIHRHAPLLEKRIQVYGMESLSHSLEQFLALMQQAEERPLMLVVDNGLLVKNPQALRTQRVIALSQRCPYRLLISDVPFTRQVSDMFSQWYVLDWRILGYRTYWGFCLNHLSTPRQACNTDYLTRAIEPYCAQILREDVQPTAARRELVWQFQLPAEGRMEYHQVMDRFLAKAAYSTTGVYCLLQACQHVVCGRRITQDYPLRTAPLYEKRQDDPRLRTLMEMLPLFPNSRVLILCRHAYECDTVYAALCDQFGPDCAAFYPAQAIAGERRFQVMNVFTDEREWSRLRADVILYYSSDWNWRKRQEKERQCQSALAGGTLTVVSLVAADTLDLSILKSVWNKENLVKSLRVQLMRTLREAETEK